jgi:hypothetical protein
LLLHCGFAAKFGDWYCLPQCGPPLLSSGGGLNGMFMVGPPRATSQC